jgi:hypothetical protein
VPKLMAIVRYVRTGVGATFISSWTRFF